MNPGLEVTDQPAVDVVTIEVDGPVSELWSDVARAFQDELVEAALDAVRGLPYEEADEALQAVDVDIHHPLHPLTLRLARGDERAVYELLIEARGLGRGRSTTDDVRAAARLFEAARENRPGRDVPTVEVRIGQAFRDLRASQRRDVCQLLATLANGADVRLVANGFMQRWLLEEHREDLPVSREAITPPNRSTIEQRVQASRDALDPDGFPVAVLRAIAGEETESAAYSTLYNRFKQRTNGRVRQVLSTLADLDLLAKYDAPAGRAVELLPAGRRLLETLDTEIGRQQSLRDSVSDSPKPSGNAVSSPAQARGTPPDGGGLVEVEDLARSDYSAAAGCASSGGFTLVDQSISRSNDGRTPRWFYDQGDEQLVVSAEYQNPMQYWVCIARSLTDWRTFYHVIDEDVLDREVFDEHLTTILRDARCLGYLPDEATSGAGYIEELEKARDELLEMTKDHHHENYDDRNDHRRDITRAALGLASAMIHLLDVVGIEVVREVRLPEFTRNFKQQQRNDLVKTLAMGASIQSTYREFAAYRQLYEDREDKRQSALGVDVDAADPTGRMIGSFVVVGPGVDSLEGDLVSRLRSPGELHDDAPEFSVPIDVSTPDRTAWAETARLMLESKNMDMTKKAVSALQAFTHSPYDTANALAGLETEKWRRDVHLDEIRYALATLPADRILPDAAPSVSSIVHALLDVERPLDRAELADRAGISTQSIRNHLEKLLALDLVREVEGGLRLSLSTSDERWSEVLPWYGTPNREREDYRDATLQGVICEVAHSLEEGSGDVLEELAGFSTTRLPPDARRGIIDVWPWIEPLLDVVGSLAADEPDQDPTAPRTARFGATIEQQPLATQGQSSGRRERDAATE